MSDANANSPSQPQQPTPSQLPAMQGRQPGQLDLREALSEIFRQIGISESDPRAQVVISEVTTLRAYQGPLPPPEMLEQYDRIYPGLKEHIVQAWQQQAEHRRGLERSTTTGSERRMDRAQSNGLIVGLASLVLAAVVGVFGSWIVAAVIAIVGVGGPNAAAILARYLPKRKE